MEELFERALREIDENIDKLPLTSDVLRAYRIAFFSHERAGAEVPAP